MVVLSTLRTRFDATKAIMKRHFHDRGVPVPEGLLIDVVRALGEAELRGYGECLAFFERPAGDNDNPQSQ